MGNLYTDNLIGTVIGLSVADDWEGARREWRIVGCEVDETHSATCVCGKEGLRYVYTIANTETGETLSPIRSSCIKKFEQSDAKEYVGKHYPNQQIVMALHNEYCKADKTHRYAVHIVINRTDLSTGKRLDEGRGKSAKVKRASRIRDLDHEWGLKQVVEGERNSSVHKKQPSRIEKELAARGIDSYKTNLRELCRIAAGEAENIYDYRELLESWGVDTEFKRGRMYVTDTDNNRYAFSVAKLDADLGTKGLEAAFTANVAKSIHAEGSAAVAEKRDIEQQKAMVMETKERYLAQIRSVYRKYRKEIRGMEGMEIVDIPKLKLPRPDSDIADDSEVKRLILACWRGADELRAEVSSTVMPKGKKNGGNAGSGGSQRAQQVPAQERPEPNKENGER